MSVKIAWCPGHCGIEGNELADENAKRAAEILSDREETEEEVKKINIEIIYKIIKEQQIQQWQRS